MKRIDGTSPIQRMRNDGRELRRHSDFGVAPGPGRRGYNRHRRPNFPVRRTSRSKLREVDFRFDGHELRGLEQNPQTGSRWARLAQEGKKVMKFL
jgi:hypothetical protein